METSEAAFADVFKGSAGKSLFPGGFNRSTFALAPRTKMLVSGSGYEVIDEDGKRLLDFNNNFTSLIHGNAHPEVTAAAVQAAKRGSSFGMPNFAETDHAAALLERLPYMEQIRYANSGTEAIALAIRVTRAATKRDLVVFVDLAYHGSSDAAALAGPSGAGIPAGVREDVLTLPINDLESLQSLFDRRGEEIAAVILDTMPNRVGLIPLTREYIQRARSLTSQYGALLVSDEVISLRQSFHGSMHSLGVTPDLMTLGKIIGGGLPVGAVVGGSDIMSVLDPTRPGYVEHGGTFTGNPVTMRAGHKALELFTREEVNRLNGLGARMREHLHAAEAFGWSIRGEGSLARILPNEQRGQTGAAAKRLWFSAYDRGLALTQNNLLAMSTPMDEAVIDDAAERLLDAVREVGAPGEAKR